MPQAVLIAALPSLIAGGAATTSAVVGAKSQSAANKRSLAASESAAARAEAAAREEDRLNREDQARRDEEDKRRWEVEQANNARKQSQEDALLKDNLARASYEDAIKYGKMVNLARLTGQPIPERPPARTAASSLLETEYAPTRQSSDPILSRPSTANATIAAPGSVADPSLSQPQRLPISNLVGRRRVI